MTMILLAGAAGLGACLRYFVTNLGKMLWPDLPLATLLINCLGAFLFAVLAQQALPAAGQLVLATGFCGGFTTFSTYMVDTVVLLREKRYVQAWTYYLGTPLLGIAAYLLGALL
jgi:CrcB protein